MVLFSELSFAADQYKSLWCDCCSSEIDDILFDKTKNLMKENSQRVFIVVDDNDFLRKALCLNLLKRNKAVVSLTRGDDLLKLLKDSDFRCVVNQHCCWIILDNQMPGTKGIEVMREINKKYRTSTNAVGLTASVILNTEDQDISCEDKKLFFKVLSKKNNIKEIDEVISRRKSI